MGNWQVNELIGRAGRWWDYKNQRVVDNFTNDTDYDALTPADQDWVAGYLYFGFFVTDEYGNTNGYVPIVADRSFHITGKSGQEGSIGEHPGTRQTYNFVRPNGSASTDPYPSKIPRPKRQDSVDLWLDAEQDDPVDVPGFPEGAYDLVLMITEESFHASPPGGDGGYWLSIRVSDWVGGGGNPITFTVGSSKPTGPTVTIVSPADGATVSGDVLIQASVSGEVVSSVEYPVDGGAGTPLSYNAATGYYEATWPTGSDGQHTITVTAVDANGTGSDSVTVTVDNSPPPSGTCHVADLEAVGNPLGKHWNATISIKVADSTGAPVSGADVTGTLTVNTYTATTNASGWASFTSWRIHKGSPGEVYTVTDISHPTLAYEPAANTDADGDSDGTSITVYRP